MKKSYEKNPLNPYAERENRIEEEKKLQESVENLQYETAPWYKKAGMKIKSGAKKLGGKIKGLAAKGRDSLLNKKDDLTEGHTKAYDEFVLKHIGYEQLPWYKRASHALKNPLVHMQYNHNKAYHELKEKPEKYESLPWYKKVGHVLANPAAHIRQNYNLRKQKKSAPTEAKSGVEGQKLQDISQIPQAPSLPEGYTVPEVSSAPEESWEDKSYHDAARRTMQGSIKEAILAYGLQQEREKKIREENRNRGLPEDHRLEEKLKLYGDYLRLKPVNSRKIHHIGDPKEEKKGNWKEKVKGIYGAVKAVTGRGTTKNLRAVNELLNTGENANQTIKKIKQGGNTSSTVQSGLDTVTKGFKLAGLMTGIAPLNMVAGTTEAISGGMKLGESVKTKNALLDHKAEDQEMQNYTDQMLSNSEANKKEGAGKLLGGILSVPGVVIKPLKIAAKVGRSVPNNLAGSDHKRTQRMVGNQAIDLDQEVNRLLAQKYTEEQWYGMSERKRKREGAEMQKLLLQSHGVQGGLDELTTQESQIRARKIVKKANSEESGKKGGLAGLLAGMGLKKNKKTGQFNEESVAEKLYSVGGKSPQEHEKEIQKAQKKEKESHLSYAIAKQKQKEKERLEKQKKDPLVSEPKMAELEDL